MLKTPLPAASMKSEVRQNRFRGAYEYLHELVYRLGPEVRLPTVVDLRESLGVSLTTLDAALAQMESENLIVRRRGSGIFVSPQVRRTLCLLCHQGYFRGAGNSPFWHMLVEEAEKRAEAKNENLSCQFLLGSQERNENEPLPRSVAEEVRSGRIHGILGVGLNKQTIAWIREHGVPIVTFAGEAGTHNVQLACVELLRLGAKLLVEKGCRRPQLWASTYPYMNPAESHYPTTAFRQALLELGIPHDGITFQLNHNTATKTVSGQEVGYDFARRVFSAPRESWPDGILIDHDLITHGALVSMTALGVQPGRDIHIVSHANAGSPLLRGMESQITMVEYDPVALVAAMFEALETLMSGQVPPQELTSILPQIRPHTF